MTTRRSLLSHVFLLSALSVLVTVSAGTSMAQQRSTDPSPGWPTGEEPYKNVWGADILVSNDGFGLGGFYRRALATDLSGVISLSISESKDEREVETYDPYFGRSFSPGKLNRFLVIPLTFGVQYRLFREDIVETFRPYIGAGVGPAIVYQMPYVDLTRDETGALAAGDVDFFKAIGRGHSHYTGTAYLTAGANFGADQSAVFGLNFRYYFTYLFSKGLPSLYDSYTGEVIASKKTFGGFYITLTLGKGS